MILNLFFSILFSFSLSHPSISDRIKSRCDLPVDRNLYDHTYILKRTGITFSESTNCYFIVNNASYMNRMKTIDDGDMDKYVVDKEKARKICARHQATLPMVLTEGEYEFLSRTYTPNQGVAWILLGLKRATNTGTYIWDNNLGVSFRPRQWTKLPNAYGTYTMQKATSGQWSEFYQNHTWSGGEVQSLSLLCHQRGYGPYGDWWPDWMPNGDENENIN